MSPTRKSTNAAKTAKKSTARKATARRATTRRATSTARRRRPTATTRRRTRPKVATTVGAALGTLVVTLLLDASWPVRIGLVLLALLVVGGYLYLQGRHHDAAEPPLEDAAPLVEPTAPVVESTPPTPATPPTEDTP
ncbi:hypothetical protein [Pedococcus sp. P5_B7]